MKQRIEKEQRAIAASVMAGQDRHRYMIEEKSEMLIMERLGSFKLMLYNRFLKSTSHDDLGSPFSLCLRAVLWTIIGLYITLSSGFIILFAILQGPEVTSAWLLSFLVNVAFSALIIRPLMLFLTRAILPCIAGHAVKSELKSRAWPRASKVLELFVDRSGGELAGQAAMNNIV